MGGGGRGLSTGQVSLSRTSIHRMLVQQGDKQSRKNKHFSFDLPLPKVEEATTTVPKRGSKKKTPKHSARLRNLNKVYLDKITDILSTGELATQLYGRGLELSEICLKSDMNGINVYWMSSGNPELDKHTGALLQRHASIVRQELSNQRVVGHSPHITFVMDDRHVKLQEVEKLLTIADYGEDFEPTNPAHPLKAAPPTLTTPLDSSIKATIEGLEGQNGQLKEDPPDPFEEALRIAASEGVTEATVELPSDLPTMRDDVLGVNTNKMYNMIQQSIKRAKAQHRQSEVGLLGAAQDYTPKEDVSPVSTNRKKVIQQWASRYKQMQKKELRSQKNKDAAMLNYPGDYHSQDLQEQEEVEVEWIEDDYEEEFE